MKGTKELIKGLRTGASTIVNEGGEYVIRKAVVSSLDEIRNIAKIMDDFPNLRVLGNNAESLAEKLLKASDGDTQILSRLNSLPDKTIETFAKDFSQADDILAIFAKDPDLVKAWGSLDGFSTLRKNISNLEILTKNQSRFTYNGKAGFEALEEVLKGHKSAKKFLENLSKVDELPSTLGVKQITAIKSSSEVRLLDDGGELLGKVIPSGTSGSRFLANSGRALKKYLDGLSELPKGVSYDGKMYRYIRSEYTDPTLIVKTKTSDGANRFQTGLYLSETKVGNVIEVASYGGTADKTLYEFTRVEVGELLDLTDPLTIERLGTSLEDLKLVGGQSPYEFTQEIAIWAKKNGYSGIKFKGTQGGDVDYINFVIFDQAIVNSSVKGSMNSIAW